MPKQRSTSRADRRPWIQYELLEWFDDSKPIRATDNRPAERRRERVRTGVSPLDPPEFRRSTGGSGSGG